MATSSLPLDVKELLTDHIESVGQLEALLLFFNHPEKSWTPASVSLELRSNSTSAAKQMAKLANSGMIKNTHDDQYIYAPVSQQLAEAVAHLQAEYAEKQVAVISYIYEKPTDKLKGFADAFKLKKD